MKRLVVWAVVTILLLGGCSSQPNSSGGTSTTGLGSSPTTASSVIRAAIKKMNSVTSLRMRTVSPSGVFVDTFLYVAPDRYNMVSGNGANQDWIDIGANHYDRYEDCWEQSPGPSNFFHFDQIVSGLSQVQYTGIVKTTYIGHFPSNMNEVRIDISAGYISKIDVPLEAVASRLVLVLDMFGKPQKVDPPPPSQVQDFCQNRIGTTS